MRIITIILLAIISTEIIAESIYLKKGDITPKEGILFDIDTAKKMRNDLIDKDTCEKVSDSYKRSLDLKDLSLQMRKEQVDILYDQNNKLMKQKADEEWMRYVWFGLGIVVMGGAVWGAGQLRK